jgi:sulfotransferase
LTLTLHALTGLPRSGSTLLANVLAQNPAFHVSPTSALAIMLAAAAHVATRAPEVKSELIRDRLATEERLGDALRGLADGWYGVHADAGQIVIDKSRAWTSHLRLFQWLFPGRMLVMVRDLRAVLGSIERQHALTGVFDDAETPQAKTLFARATSLFADDGLIGSCIHGIEDLIRRKDSAACVHVIRYEDLVADPTATVRAIYAHLELEPYGHDFERVANTTGLDVDGLYLHKFPHQGHGAIEQRAPDWSEWVSADIAEQITAQFAGFNKAFGYA